MTTETDVFTALRGFILSLPITVAADNVVRGLDNNVPQPLGPYIMMTEARKTPLATNETTYNGVDTKTLTAFCKMEIQVDFYGPDAGDWALIFTTAFRDQYCVDQMGPYVAPLYCGDEIAAPLVNGEEQYEKRRIVMVNLEYNPDVDLPQEFADTLEVMLVNVETTYP